MPETMVERVARAIFDAWAKENGVKSSWEEALSGHAKHASEGGYLNAHNIVSLARLEARAALQALREPTEAMVRANGTSPVEAGQRWLDEDARTTWRAMIDAALSEGAER